jgi:hypothetical protein
MHAVSVEDFVYAIRERTYEIVQFTGHGAEDAFYFEDSKSDYGCWLSAQQLAGVLGDAAPRLRAAIFMSCFSSTGLGALVGVAPYLITVTGQIEDEVAIHWSTSFYDYFLRHNSVEEAFRAAQLFVEARHPGHEPTTVLSRRAVATRSHALVQVFPSGGDSILVDVSEAEDDISELGIPREKFLGILSRKIRVHKRVFETPRQQAILSVGPYFGVFSWQSANDAVICHRIIRIRPEIDETACRAWAALVLRYNDYYAARYRSSHDPNSPLMRGWLKDAIESYVRTRDLFLDRGPTADVLRSLTPEQFKVTKSIYGASLEMAEIKYYAEDHASTVMYLEAILSSIHDLVDDLTARVTW